MRYIILMAFSIMAAFSMSQGAGKYKIGALKSDFPKIKTCDSVLWGERWNGPAIKLVSDSTGGSERFKNTSQTGSYDIFPSLGRYETYCARIDTINNKLIADYAYASFADGKLVAANLYVNGEPYFQNMIDALFAKYGNPAETTESSYRWKIDGSTIYCEMDRYQKNMAISIKFSGYSEILEEYRSERDKIFNRMKKAEDDRRKAQLLEGF